MAAPHANSRKHLTVGTRAQVLDVCRVASTPARRMARNGNCTRVHWLLNLPVADKLKKSQSADQGVEQKKRAEDVCAMFGAAFGTIDQMEERALAQSLG